MVHHFQRANTLVRGAFALFGVYLAAISLPSVAAEEARWVDPISGNWQDAPMWSTAPVYPTNGQPDAAATYDVIIDAAGSDYEVLIEQGIEIDSLIIDSPDATIVHERGQIRAGLLEVSSGTFLFGPYHWDLPIADTLIRKSGGEFEFSGYSFRLDNVSFDGEFEMPHRTVWFTGGLTLVDDAKLSWEAGGTPQFQGNQTIGGEGAIVLNGGLTTEGTLTISPSIFLDITDGRQNFTGPRIVNEGTIRIGTGENANSRAELRIRSDEFVNQGFIEVNDRLTLGEPADSKWKNEGEIQLLPGAGLVLEGEMLTSDLGTITHENESYLRFEGTIDNRNDTLNFDDFPQETYLYDIDIRGGTISSTHPIAGFRDSVTLEDVTLEADLELDTTIYVAEDMLLSNADIRFTRYGQMSFTSEKPQELSGTGNISLDGKTLHFGGPLVSTAPGITVESLALDYEQRGKVFIELANNRGTIISGRSVTEFSVELSENSGRIVSNAPDATVVVDALDNRGWQNTGVLEVNAGRLVLQNLTSFDDMGEVINRGGIVEVGGHIPIVDKTLSLDGNWELHAGVLGGRIEVPNGSLTTFEGTLQDVALAGAFLITSEHLPRTDALGTLTLEDAQFAIGVGAELRFENHPFGRGSFVLNSPYKDAWLSKTTGLIIPPTFSVSTGPDGGGSIVAGTTNEGTLSASTPGTELRVVGQLRNNGTVQAIGGGKLIAGGTAPLPEDSLAKAGGVWLVDSKSQIRFEYENGYQFHENDHIIVELGDVFSEPLISSTAETVLAGTLDVRLSSSRVPRTDREYPLFGGTKIDGSFADVMLPPLPDGFEWDQTKLTTTGALFVDGPTPTFFAQTRFSEPPLGVIHYAPTPDDQEIGFTSSVSPSNGADSYAGVITKPSASAGRGFLFTSVDASTTFATVDLSSFVSVEIGASVQVSPTSYEDSDFMRIAVTNGVDEIEVMHISGDQIERLVDLGTPQFSVGIPDSWQQAAVVYSSFNNSSTGAENFLLDSIQFSGYEASLFRRGLNGSGETYFENFDAALGTRTGQLPAGWQAENDSGVTKQIDSLGLHDGPLGNDGTSFLVNVGGSPERFGTTDPQRVATWKDDLNGDSLVGPEDVIADSHTDRALGNARAASDELGTLSFSIPIAGNPLRAFTIDWDLEVWGGAPLAARRGGDGAGYAAELKVGGVTYYENRKTLFPGELFDTALDGGVDNRNPTLIDGNAHAVRSTSTDIIEVDITDGAVGNLIELSFNANHGPDAGGWIQAIDNVQLRALAPGDADASGTVDTDDLLTLLAGRKFNQGVDGVTWAQGDFNADDEFNTDDLLAILSFLSGTFPSNPYASEAGGPSDAVADVIVNSQTGEVSVFLAGNEVASVIIDSAAEIFHVSDSSEVDWNTSGLFESASAGQISNTLFTSTLTGSSELGQVISDEFLNGDFQFEEDLTVQIYAFGADGELGALDVEISVVPEPSTFVLTLLGATCLLACGRRLSSQSRMIGIRP